ncbi:MAG: hypothetical protein QNL04_00785 [SAR324 cluster bacterium]|nr:hypothetical protein [SAR324 cluster bacterium]
MGESLACVIHKRMVEGKATDKAVPTEDAFQWDWDEHLFVAKAKGESLQSVINRSPYLKDKNENLFTVKQVTEHNGRVYFPITTGETVGEKNRARYHPWASSQFGVP